jgi:hypothetical protein
VIFKLFIYYPCDSYYLFMAAAGLLTSALVSPRHLDVAASLAHNGSSRQSAGRLPPLSRNPVARQYETLTH